MDRDRHRRFLTILLLGFVYVLSSYIQSYILDQIEATAPDIKASKHFTGKELNKLSKTEASDEKTKFQSDVEVKEKNHLEDDFSDIPKLYVELRTCLLRFICEVHAQAPDVRETSDLEKNVLSLFRSYVFLEGPSSPIYSYQLAAHMGQLASGLIPSPCHSMYPSCPLPRYQLLELLSGVRSMRKSFY